MTPQNSSSQPAPRGGAARRALGLTALAFAASTATGQLQHTAGPPGRQRGADNDLHAGQPPGLTGATPASALAAGLTISAIAASGELTAIPPAREHEISHFAHDL